MPPQDHHSSAAPFIGSIALVRRRVGEEELWLALWDDLENAYSFIQAARGEGESYRSCLDVEIEAALGLSRKTDYLIAGLSRAHFQAPIEWPGAEQAQWVIVQFFSVDLYGDRGREIVDQLANVRWLSAREIARGCTYDGDAINARQCTLIERADLLPAHIDRG